MLVCSSAYEALLENVQFIHNPQTSTYLQGQLKGILKVWGAVERWNRTLKDMLSKNVQEHGSDWDLHLPFCYSHIGNTPQYNRHVAIPISIRTVAFGTHISSQGSVGRRKKHPNYSLPFSGKVSGRLNRKKLRKAHEIAAETAEATQNNYASYYNLRSRKSNSSKSGTSWLDLRSRLRFRGPSLCSNRYGCIIYGDVTDHISSDCQELDDVQRLELLNTLGKFSSLFSSLPGLAK
ncbi:hypothetical protein TNCV_1690241 [Trichonephila clavipes]|nr:hypothetical protein TNCV_1690241 [Trichonephila clavipes]